jgi:hypothetical protein
MNVTLSPRHREAKPKQSRTQRRSPRRHEENEGHSLDGIVRPSRRRLRRLLRMRFLLCASTRLKPRNSRSLDLRDLRVFVVDLESIRLSDDEVKKCQ